MGIAEGDMVGSTGSFGDALGPSVPMTVGASEQKKDCEDIQLD